MDFTDQDALDAIARLINGNKWDSDLVCSIAEIVHGTGRPLKETANLSSLFPQHHSYP